MEPNFLTKDMELAERNGIEGDFEQKDIRTLIEMGQKIPPLCFCRSGALLS